MISSYKVFFTPQCPKCPSIKAYLGKQDLKAELIDAATPEGLDEARKFNVANVPTVIFFDENVIILALQKINFNHAVISKICI